jgi:hypothetical protein
MKKVEIKDAKPYQAQKYFNGKIYSFVEGNVKEGDLGVKTARGFMSIKEGAKQRF